jgi:uncharacterized protein with HEPN domain
MSRKRRDREYLADLEAVKKLSAPVKQMHPHLPWKQMAGMRDKAVHDYFGINDDIVWALAKEELPVLLPSLTAINPGDI